MTLANLCRRLVHACALSLLWVEVVAWWLSASATLSSTGKQRKQREQPKVSCVPRSARTIFRSHVSQESAEATISAGLRLYGFTGILWHLLHVLLRPEVVSQTMRDAQVQFTAREFSKESTTKTKRTKHCFYTVPSEELLNQLLHDEEMTKTVASWTCADRDRFVDVDASKPYLDQGECARRCVHISDGTGGCVVTCGDRTLRLLTSIQEEIGALFVHILQQDQVRYSPTWLQSDLGGPNMTDLQVVDEVNRLADKLVAYLCASQTIQDSGWLACCRFGFTQAH